jgi:lipase
VTARRTDQPELHVIHSAGADLAFWEWQGAGPPIVFFHAAGFHGRIWDQAIRYLPGRQMFALELRGHGRSGRTAPPCHWAQFAEDSLELARRLGLRGAIGVGHSLGGHVAVAVALERPGTFDALLLLDPTIFRQEWHGREKFDASFIRKRRAVWKSVDEMLERFRHRKPFVSWDPVVLRNYCEFGLLPDGGGSLSLACPPEIEASIYECALEPAANLQPRLASLTASVTVLRAGKAFIPGVFDISASPTDPKLSRLLPRATERILAGRDHYFPMESPELVVAALKPMTAAYF